MRKIGMTGLATAVLAAVLVALHGCGGGGGGGGGGAGPTISNVEVLPSTWSSGGGNATIQADVSDPNGVAAVSADVTGPSGTKSIVLTKPSGSAHYTGQYTVPANTTAGGSTKVYSVVISATNTTGGKSSAPAVQFSVPAPDQPPPPPSQG